MTSFQYSTIIAVACAAFSFLAPVRAAAAEDSAGDREQLLVLTFLTIDGAEEARAQLLSDLLVGHLQQIQKYDIVSQDDVVAMLGLEEQKQLIGCDDASCIAEIGGALGAPWLISGRLGLLGEQHVLTLKLLDIANARLENQVSERLPSDVDALPEVMRIAAYDLLRMEAPDIEPWYAKAWVWVVIGGVTAAVAGATVGIAVAVSSQHIPPGNLGQVTF